MRDDVPPQMSILIPAYYSEDTLAECLEALRQQRFRDFEVIVVNSSPGDRTRRLVEERFHEVIRTGADAAVAARRQESCRRARTGRHSRLHRSRLLRPTGLARVAGRGAPRGP